MPSLLQRLQELLTTGWHNLAPDEVKQEVENLAMQRCEHLAAREKAVAEKERWLKDWGNHRHILEATYQDDWPTGDIIIRVKRSRLIHKRTLDVTAEDCEVSSV
jgi:hypothetical protein